MYGVILWLVTSLCPFLLYMCPDYLLSRHSVASGISPSPVLPALPALPPCPLPAATFPLAVGTGRRHAGGVRTITTMASAAGHVHAGASLPQPHPTFQLADTAGKYLPIRREYPRDKAGRDTFPQVQCRRGSVLFFSLLFLFF